MTDAIEREWASRGERRDEVPIICMSSISSRIDLFSPVILCVCFYIFFKKIHKDYNKDFKKCCATIPYLYMSHYDNKQGFIKTFFFLLPFIIYFQNK